MIVALGVAVMLFAGLLAMTLKPQVATWFLLPLLLVGPWAGVDDGLLKAALLGVLLMFLARFGLQRDAAAMTAIVGLNVSLLLTIVNGLPLGLTDSDAFRAWAGYSFAFLALLVNWPYRARYSFRWIVALAAPASVVLGAALTASGLWDLAGRPDGGQLRLQGSLIPPHLAMLALIGVAIVLTDTASTFGRRATIVAGVNMAIVLATLTRGAILAMTAFVLVLAIPRLLGARRQSQYRAIWTTAVGLCLGMLAAVPAILARSAGTSYEGGFNSSGRSAAWQFYWNLSEGYRATGRGLGFSAIANEEYAPSGVQVNFVAPHNEYIHLILDGGVLLLTFYIVAFTMLLLGRRARRARSLSKTSALALAVMLAGFSYVDNPLSTPQFLLPLLLLVACREPLRAFAVREDESADRIDSKTAGRPR